jgi:hypothetical protein
MSVRKVKVIRSSHVPVTTDKDFVQSNKNIKPSLKLEEKIIKQEKEFKLENSLNYSRKTKFLLQK